jgi:hypothetical protein
VAEISGGAARNRNSKPVIHSVLELLFASDVPLGCLHRSVARQKLNLFQFTSTTMAKPGAFAAKVVGRRIYHETALSSSASFLRRASSASDG